MFLSEPVGPPPAPEEASLKVCGDCYGRRQWLVQDIKYSPAPPLCMHLKTNGRQLTHCYAFSDQLISPRQVNHMLTLVAGYTRFFGTARWASPANFVSSSYELLGDDRCPFPTKVTLENRRRLDPYEAMMDHNIFRNRQDIPGMRPRAGDDVSSPNTSSLSVPMTLK